MRLLFILTTSPFTERDFKRFGVDYLRLHFEVIILDCTPYLKPKVWNLYSEIAYKAPGYALIQNYDELEKILTSLSVFNSIVIDYLNAGRKEEKVRKRFQRDTALIIKVRVGLLPSNSLKESGRFKIFRLMKKACSWAKLLDKLSLIYSPPIKPDIVLIGGEAGYEDKVVQSAQFQILAHSFDYDIFLNLKNGSRCHESDYAVFLDEDMVYHSDYMTHGVCAPASEERYYVELNRFFDVFEEHTSMQVVFAAHPRSRYDLRPELLNGRSFIIGETAKLIRDSKLVFLHASTAQSFAVLWKKPMLFLTSDELDTSWIGPHINHNADIFNCDVINISHLEKLSFNEALFKIDEFCYKNYHQQYIKVPGSEEKIFWQIFVDFIKRFD